MTSMCSFKVVDDGCFQITSRPGVTRFNLTEDGASWVDVSLLPKDLVPSQEEFDKLWDLHPKAQGRIRIMGKEIQVPRWQQSYLKPYRFSGMVHPALPLPSEVQPYLDFANSSKLELWPGREAKLNEVLLNWYQGGSMYIGPHSDDEKDLVTGVDGETLVWSLTLQDSGSNNRTFRLKPKRKGKSRLDIYLENGMIVVMGGTCQRTHKHQVPKVTGEGYLRRINVTIREFQE